MSVLPEIPENVIGMRLCRMTGRHLRTSECVTFVKGRPAVETTLRRASLAGRVGPLGETGDYWADLLTDGEGSWVETVALDRQSWNSLKNHWMRCKMEPTHDHRAAAQESGQ